MTTEKHEALLTCPKEFLLKMLTGKWKPCIFRYASQGPVRFGQIMKLLPEASKQALTIALREMEASGILERNVVTEKPLNVQYILTDLGGEFIPIFKVIDGLGQLPARAI
jgi:DNA-binding HxlR family transcriptional regulator